MPFFLLIPILIVLVVVCLIAAILAVALFAVVAVTGLSAALILHKFGYDRRLIAYIAQRGRTSPNVNVKVTIDDLDDPATSPWMFENRGPRRPA